MNENYYEILVLPGLITLSGTTTYAVLAVSVAGFHLQHSFYFAVAAFVCSFISSIASLAAVPRIKFLPEYPRNNVSDESLTDVTVLT